MHTLSSRENPENFTHCEPPEKIPHCEYPGNFTSRWEVCARPAGSAGARTQFHPITMKERT